MCVGVLFLQSHDCFSPSLLLSCFAPQPAKLCRSRQSLLARQLVGIDRVIVLNADLIGSSKDQARECYERRERSQSMLVPSEGTLRV